MLQASIWDENLLFYFIVFLGYYGYVILRFFRPEASRVIKWVLIRKGDEAILEDEETDEDRPGIRTEHETDGTKQEDADQEQKEKVTEEERTPVKEKWTPPAKEVRSLLPIAQELAVELKGFIEKAKTAGMDREPLILGLIAVIAQEPYKSLRHAPIRDAINNMILIEVLNSCSIQLDAGELERLWSS